MQYSLRQIADITGGELSGSPDQEITRISIDSRTVSQPEGNMFLAIQGERHDGHKYIPELVERGFRAFMVQLIPDGADGVSFVLVKDTLKALQDLAAYHRSQYDATVIGITGSNGKTIVKEWAHQALSPGQKIVRSPKSYNSQVGVPLSVLLLERNSNMGIFEAGISLPGEMKNLQRIIRPEIGLITNIGEAHREGFSDRDEKIREKIILVKDCNAIIYCRDQKDVDRIITGEFPPERLFSWSFDEGSDLKVSSMDGEEEGSRFKILHEEVELEITVPFTDRASIENALHVTALMIYLDLPPLVIQSRIADLIPVAMRMEMVKGVNGCTLINDTYNSDLVSLSIALDYLNQQEQHERKSLILSDLMQTGRMDEELYSEVAGMLRKKKVDRFIGIGPALLGQRGQFTGEAKFYASTSDFLASLHTTGFRDEAILIKGSRAFTFEKITQRLQEKNHRTVLEIDLNALVHNLNIYRSMTDARIMVMVKAFSYGSGSVEIANVLQYQKVDYLCVAYVDEGITLREAGIHLPILVMNPEVSGFDLMIDYNLEPEIYNFRSLFTFIRALGIRNLENYPIHLKLETGMNRLGFKEEELDQLFEVLNQNPGIAIRSVFSHLGASDLPEHDAYTRNQISNFERMSNSILERFPGDAIRHLLNSAGIERFPEAVFDMVRLGIGLYGISPIPGNSLQAVSSLKSIISQVKTVNKGESVGYGRNYTVEGDMRIAIVPVGYADGLSRDLGNRGVSFRVNGSDAAVLGNICMDMSMVDVTNLDAQEGDEVLIFGKEKPVTELAEKLGTIPYEVLAGLSQRVKRVYFQE